MTASYDYFELKYSHEGLKSGFIYKTVPHVTFKSIANNPEIDEIYVRMRIPRFCTTSRQYRKINCASSGRSRSRRCRLPPYWAWTKPNGQSRRIIPSGWHQDQMRKQILFALNMDTVVGHVNRFVRLQNTEKLEAVFDELQPIGPTSRMRSWLTTKPCQERRCGRRSVMWYTTARGRMNRPGF